MSFENTPVAILTRSHDGQHTTHRYHTTVLCRKALTDQTQPAVTENDEILLVTLGDIVLYSRLASDKILTVDDLTGFFA